MTQAETKAQEPRPLWNYRCDACWAETPVYRDNDLCYYCDPASHDEIQRGLRKLDGVKP